LGAEMRDLDSWEGHEDPYPGRLRPDPILMMKAA